MNIYFFNIKRILIFAVTMLMVVPVVEAHNPQHGGPPFDRKAFEAKLNAYIIAEVELTPEEAGKFIPLVEEFRQKKFELGFEMRRFQRELRSKKNVSDEELTKVIDLSLDVKAKEISLEKEYYEKFKAILSPRKILKYQQAELSFARDFFSKDERGNGNKDTKDNQGRR